jgi:hypothetical protein
VRYRIRKSRADGIVEIRRRSILDAFLTAEVAVLAALLLGWAISIGALVEALLAEPALTSMVVVVGTASVSLAVVVGRLTDDPSVRDGPFPPPGNAA